MPLSHCPPTNRSFERLRGFVDEMLKWEIQALHAWEKQKERLNRQRETGTVIENPWDGPGAPDLSEHRTGFARVDTILDHLTKNERLVMEAVNTAFVARKNRLKALNGTSARFLGVRFARWVNVLQTRC